ncbi:hypothetical protein [Sphingobacterium sp. UBA6320]|uniref:hypothetical protein n=1 Tax=Sphingobacterium sp. UBA6320 TaxID=1947510 RepID=UPI0025DEF5FB|nr:hypothetical protein [Sphingobacterium sp. UBA6320]
MIKENLAKLPILLLTLIFCVHLIFAPGRAANTGKEDLLHNSRSTLGDTAVPDSLLSNDSFELVELDNYSVAQLHHDMPGGGILAARDLSFGQKEIKMPVIMTGLDQGIAYLIVSS